MDNDDSLIQNEDLLCIICGEKNILQLDELLSYPCGHTTCIECGKNWNKMNMERIQAIKCPNCNIKLEENDFKIFKIDTRWKSVLREIHTDKKNMRIKMLEEISKREEEEKKYKMEIEEKNKENQELQRNNELLLIEKKKIIEMIQLKTEENEKICKLIEDSKKELLLEKERRMKENEKNEKLIQENKSILKENERIKKEILENQQNLEKDKRKLEKERLILEREFENIQSERQQNEQLRIQTLNDKNLLEEENQMIKQEKERIEEEKEQLEEEKEQLEREKEQLEMEKMNLVEENQKIMIEKERMLEERESLKTENELFKKDKEKLEKKFNNVKREKSNLEEIHKEKITEMEDNLNNLRQEAEEKERQKKELEEQQKNLLDQIKNSQANQENQKVYVEKNEHLLKAIRNVEMEKENKDDRIKELEEKISNYQKDILPTSSTQVSQAIDFTSRYFNKSIQYLPNMEFFYSGYKKLIGQKKSVGVLKKDSKDYVFLEKRGSNMKTPVYKAKCNSEVVAIKKISIKYSEEKSDEIFRQAMLLHSLSDLDGLIQLNGIFTKDSYIHLVFPYVESDLEFLIFQNKDAKMIDHKQKVNVTLQLIETIYQLHKYGIVHRDLRPNSFVCYKKEENWYPLLCSWNNACYEKDAKPFHAPSYFRYMPPERFYSGKIHNWKGYDIWSLGCIIGELFLGKPLFYIWGERKREALSSIFSWKECLPDNPKDFLSDFDEDIDPSNSLFDSLQEIGVDDWLAQMICSFLSFDPHREIFLDQDNFDFKEKNYSAKNLEDQFISSWLLKHYEIN